MCSVHQGPGGHYLLFSKTQPSLFMAVAGGITAPQITCVLVPGAWCVNLEWQKGFEYVDKSRVLRWGMSLSCTDGPDVIIMAS